MIGRALRGRDVSKSMIAFGLALTGVFALAVTAWLPPLLGADSGIRVSRPGLFEVAPAARGVATLPGGLSVEVYPSGIRVRDRDGILLDTVIRGAPLSAVAGQVTGTGGRRSEEVDWALSNLRITAVTTNATAARYSGEFFDEHRRLHLDLDVAVRGKQVRLIARAPGADALIFHLDNDFSTIGYLPALPDRNLRKRAWWLRNTDGRGGANVTSARGADMALLPDTVDRALDLREQGRTDAHIWAPTAELVLSRRADPAVADSDS